MKLNNRNCKDCILFVDKVERLWFTKPSYCIKDYKKVDETNHCVDFCNSANSVKCKNCKVYNCIHNDVNDFDEGHAF